MGLASRPDRIGALDFQRSASEYRPHAAQNATLAELQASAERVEKGIPLTPELDQALFHGSSIGGARPKALIEDKGVKYIAKFASTTDLYSVMKAEYIAMRLANLAGLNVAPVQLTKSANKDVLLIERFDRKCTQSGWLRKPLISALTILGLDDMMARYASYPLACKPPIISCFQKMMQKKSSLTPRIQSQTIGQRFAKKRSSRR